MICTDCGTEIEAGAYFCDGCGRPLGFGGSGLAGGGEDLGFDEVPEPAASREAPGPAVSAPPVEVEEGGEATRPAGRRPGRALCSMCMGSFPETAMAVVDGRTFCADCSPMSARRSLAGVQGAEETPAPAPAPAGTAARARRPVVISEEPVAGGGLKAVLSVLLVLLLLGGGYAGLSLFGGDRIDRMIRGAENRGDARLLLQKYERGRARYYDVRMRLRLEQEGGSMGLANNLEASADVSGRVITDVLEVDDRGNARLRFAMEGFAARAEAYLDGTPFPAEEMERNFERMNGTVLELSVDPFGEPIGEATVVSKPAGGGPRFEDLFGGRLAGVPHRELRVGDTWTARVAIPFEAVKGVDSVAITATYEVEGYKRLGGRDCLVISVVGDMSRAAGSGPMTLPGRTEADLEVSIKGVMFFDPVAGEMVKNALDAEVELSAAGAMGGLEVNVKLELDIDLK